MRGLRGCGNEPRKRGGAWPTGWEPAACVGEKLWSVEINSTHLVNKSITERLSVSGPCNWC